MTAAPEVPADWAEAYRPSTREVYRRTLEELAEADPRVFCVDSDMGGLETGFGARFPDRYANVGIAEANLVGVSAGLASMGLRPYANTISTFAACRACEQLKVDVAGNDLPVRVVVTHAGFSAGHYGPTHHALEDVAIMRTLPNMTVVVPADSVETEAAVRATADLPGPLFLRLGRAATPLVHHAPCDFVLGRAARLREGDDLTIVATGPYPVLMALEAHDLLASAGIGARVLNVHTVKPIDREALVAAAEETGAVITVEDHVLAGGLGGAVCEVLAETSPCPVRRIGVPDAFCDLVGDELELLAAAGVGTGAIVAAATALRAR
ncbi:transketolase family protein [Saccharothrix longispora]|uniref:Transketolase n=1 Tax=Saccharothrix longispora TaxID=33920 RepID=A0ABU1PTM2_9PSEU|nr:transketolase C-terminal domain-containing protein [Saccharothrix longispora]MDR6594000.1 transketolase [Saccharothrix longispora]